MKTRTINIKEKIESDNPNSYKSEKEYLLLRELNKGYYINDRYIIEALLGIGGFGIVYKVYDRVLKKIMVLKFLNPKFTSLERKFIRVKREISISQNIIDKNIVRIFTLDKYKDIYFFVMEFIDGKTLQEIIEKNGKYSLDDFIPLFYKILRGIKILHQNNIVHRDIKPANIMILKNGDIKVLDLGLAKGLDDNDKTSSINEIVGSLQYMSPEQLEGEDINHKSDIYQLGLIFYYSISGDLPFNAESNTYEMLFKRISESPKKLKAIGIKAPKYIEYGIEKMIEKNPKNRFDSIAELENYFKKKQYPIFRNIFKKFKTNYIHNKSIIIVIILILNFGLFLGWNRFKKYQKQQYIKLKQRQIQKEKQQQQQKENLAYQNDYKEHIKFRKAWENNQINNINDLKKYIKPTIKKELEHLSFLYKALYKKQLKENIFYFIPYQTSLTNSSSEKAKMRVQYHLGSTAFSGHWPALASIINVDSKKLDIYLKAIKFDIRKKVGLFDVEGGNEAKGIWINRYGDLFEVCKSFNTNFSDKQKKTIIKNFNISTKILFELLYSDKSYIFIRQGYKNFKRQYFEIDDNHRAIFHIYRVLKYGSINDIFKTQTPIIQILNPNYNKDKIQNLTNLKVVLEKYGKQLIKIFNLENINTDNFIKNICNRYEILQYELIKRQPTENDILNNSISFSYLTSICIYEYILLKKLNSKLAKKYKKICKNLIKFDYNQMIKRKNKHFIHYSIMRDKVFAKKEDMPETFSTIIKLNSYIRLLDEKYFTNKELIEIIINTTGDIKSYYTVVRNKLDDINYPYGLIKNISNYGTIVTNNLPSMRIDYYWVLINKKIMDL